MGYSIEVARQRLAGRTEVRRVGRASGLLATAALIVVAPLVWSSSFGLNMLILVCLYGSLAVSYNLFTGFTGYLTLAHASFFGVGVYASAVGTTKYHLSPIIAVVLGFVISLCSSLVLGSMLFRRVRGFTFSIVTLGFAISVYVLASNWISLTSGPLGIPGLLPGSINWFGLDIGLLSLRNYYYLGALLGILATAVTVVVARSRVGRALLGIREDEDLASAFAVDPMKYKLLAFAMSACLASLAGSYYVYYISIASPDVFWMYWITALLAIFMVGGPGRRVIGQWLSAAALVIGPAYLSFAQGSQELLYGISLLAIVLLVPGGVNGLIDDRLYRSRIKRQPSSERPRRQSLTVSAEPSARSQVPSSRTGVGGSLSVRGVSKSFGGVRALQDVSFEVGPGELVGLIGPNGSGKSTLFSCMAGTLSPDAGAIQIAGVSVAGRSPAAVARLGVSRTFQDARVFPRLTVEENLLLAAQEHEGCGILAALFHAPGVRRSERALRARVEEAAEIIALTAFLPVRAGDLSYGQRKLLAVGMAWMVAPKLLLLDEPLAAVNPTMIEEIVVLVQKLRDTGHTIVIVEHNLSAVMRLAERVVVLANGQVLSEGSPADVREDPRVVEAYFGR